MLLGRLGLRNLQGLFAPLGLVRGGLGEREGATQCSGRHRQCVDWINLERGAATEIALYAMSAATAMACNLRAVLESLGRTSKGLLAEDAEHGALRGAEVLGGPNS